MESKTALSRFEELKNCENRCFLCLKECDNLCDKCGLVVFCSQAHFEVHHKASTGYCYPFKVLQRPQVGRYLTATRDLNPLDLIIEDEPAFFGPSHATGQQACLECLIPVTGEFVCSKCALPLCGPSCSEKGDMTSFILHETHIAASINHKECAWKYKYSACDYFIP